MFWQKLYQEHHEICKLQHSTQRILRTNCLHYTYFSQYIFIITILL